MPFPELDHLDLEKLRETAKKIEGDIECVQLFLDAKRGWMRDSSLERIAYLETVLAKVKRRIAQLETPAQE